MMQTVHSVRIVVEHHDDRTVTARWQFQPALDEAAREAVRLLLANTLATDDRK